MKAGEAVVWGGLIVAGLSGGCASTPPPPPPEQALWRSETMMGHELCTAMLQAARGGDLERAPRLVDFLAHEDAGVRACANHALIELYGSDPVGYRPYATISERKSAIFAWREELARAGAAHPDGAGRENP